MSLLFTLLFACGDEPEDSKMAELEVVHETEASYPKPKDVKQVAPDETSMEEEPVEDAPEASEVETTEGE